MNSMDLLFAVGFLALGIAFRMGKCADWVLGKDPDVRGKFNEQVSMRFFSVLMFVLSACNWVSVLGTALGIGSLVMVGIVLNIVVLIAGMVYFMKNKRFRK